jgi:Thioesterase superfamily
VVFSSGLNEDLGATAIFGSQMVGLFPRPKYDGALGIAVVGGVPTINLRIDCLRPAVGGALTGTARVRRAGRTVTLVDVDVYDEQQTLVAVGRGTYSGQRG